MRGIARPTTDRRKSTSQRSRVCHHTVLEGVTPCREQHQGSAAPVDHREKPPNSSSPLIHGRRRFEQPDAVPRRKPPSAQITSVCIPRCWARDPKFYVMNITGGSSLRAKVERQLKENPVFGNPVVRHVKQTGVRQQKCCRSMGRAPQAKTVRHTETGGRGRVDRSTDRASERCGVDQCRPGRDGLLSWTWGFLIGGTDRGSQKVFHTLS